MQHYKPLLRWFWVVIVLFFSIQMLRLILPYLTPPFPTDIDFLQTKQHVLSVTLWRWAFYVHISSSIFALLGGLTQFSSALFRRYPIVHRWVGKIYVFSILFLSAPSGFIMAFYANGGWRTQTAFVLLSVLWWGFTWYAYRAARRYDWRAHGTWMLRSYALSWSAVSLRIMQFLVGLLGLWDYQTAYLLAAWGGWIINLVFVELLLYLGFLRYALRRD